jgi:hypothetical protein
MKQIIQEYQPEDAKFFCDKHSDRECFSELQLISWYGSVFDLNILKVHLCDECVKEMYDYLKKEFKSEPKELEL